MPIYVSVGHRGEAQGVQGQPDGKPSDQWPLRAHKHSEKGRDALEWRLRHILEVLQPSRGHRQARRHRPEEILLQSDLRGQRAPRSIPPT